MQIVIVLLLGLFVEVHVSAQLVTQRCEADGTFLFVNGTIVDLSKLLDSGLFRCRAKYMTIVASEKIIVNAHLNSPFYGGLFTLMLITKEIVQDDKPGCECYKDGCANPIVLSVAGFDGLQDLAKLKRIYAHGGPGGNFIGIAQTWTNAESIRIDVHPGRRGCRVEERYHRFPSDGSFVYNDITGTNFPSTVFLEVVSVHGRRYGDLDILAGPNPMTPPLDEVTPVFVYDALEVKVAHGGLYPGKEFLRGLNSENVKKKHFDTYQPTCTITRQDSKVLMARRQVRVPSEFNTSDPNAVKAYNDKIRERDDLGPKWYIAQGSEEKPFFKWPPRDVHVDALKFVRLWIVNADNNEWSLEDRIQILNSVDEAHKEFRVDSLQMFYDELKMIVENSKTLGKDSALILLKSLRQRMANFPHGNNTQTRGRLVYGYAACSANIIRIERAGDLIIDISKFLDPILTSLSEEHDNLNQIQLAIERNRLITAASQQYEEENNRQIAEAMALVQQTFLPEIENIQKILEGQLKTAKDEVEALIDQANAEQKLVEENLKKATSLAIFHSAMGFLKFGAALLSFIGPAGAIIGTGIGGAANLVQTVVDGTVTPAPTTPVQVPPSIKNELQPVEDWIERKRRHLEKNLEDAITSFAALGTEGAYVAALTQQLSEIKGLAAEQNKRKKISTIKSIDTAFKAELKRIAETGVTTRSRRQTNEDKDKKKEAAAAIVEKASDAANAAVQTAFSDNDKIKGYELRIEEIKKNVMVMTEFQDSIQEKMLPAVLDMFDSIILGVEEFDRATLASIDVTSWNVKKNIDDVRFQFKRVLSDLKVGDEVDRSFANLDTVFDGITRVYGHIAEIREKQRYADFQVELSRASTLSLFSNADQLIWTLQKNMLAANTLGLVDRVSLAFQLWAFPFGREFLSPLDELTLDFGLKNDEQMYKRGLDRLKLINRNIEIYRSTIHGEIDHHRVNISYAEGDLPFFVWNWTDNQESISKLLKGETVIFQADIKQVQDIYLYYKQEAIKFRTVTLNFDLNPDTRQQEFNAALQRFNLNMVHMGQSNYHFQGKNYLFQHSTQRFGLRSTTVSPEGTVFAGQTFSFGKYAAGDASLSPYGFWKMKLVGRTHGSDYGTLELMADEKLNVELVGDGTAVQPFFDEEYRDPNIDIYFKEFEVQGFDPAVTSSRASGRSGNCKPRKFKILPPHRHLLEDANGEVHGQTGTGANSKDEIPGDFEGEKADDVQYASTEE